MLGITLFAINEEKGAQTSIYLASSPEVEGVTGKYFDKSKVANPAPSSKDEAAWKRLWTISEELAKDYIPAAQIYPGGTNHERVKIRATRRVAPTIVALTPRRYPHPDHRQTRSGA